MTGWRFYVTVFVLGCVIGGLQALADEPDGYRHPCAEDEYVRVDGACVHGEAVARKFAP